MDRHFLSNFPIFISDFQQRALRAEATVSKLKEEVNILKVKG